jgi:hypothetical protein
LAPAVPSCRRAAGAGGAHRAIIAGRYKKARKRVSRTNTQKATRPNWQQVDSGGGFFPSIKRRHGWRVVSYWHLTALMARAYFWQIPETWHWHIDAVMRTIKTSNMNRIHPLRKQPTRKKLNANIPRWKNIAAKLEAGHYGVDSVSTDGIGNSKLILACFWAVKRASQRASLRCYEEYKLRWVCLALVAAFSQNEKIIRLRWLHYILPIVKQI